ncbi:NAD(P)H-dependent oxidoreductase [Geminicoccaceae bacterium 1502E]|nr:NAD(P)H-dependent oxidoreductase [Geminicoccaceae bacterium 1502E]
MPRRITILQGHPDRAGDRLCHALADAYAAGALEAGHEVRRVEVARLHFPLLRSQGEFEAGLLPVDLVEAQEAIRWAEHLVLVFPLWLGTAPALLKGFLEQMLRPGFAFTYGEHGLPKKVLRGRSARIVVTMGMPAFVYRWWYCAHGLRGIRRNMLGFVGIRPIRMSLFGRVEAAGDTARRRWLERMRQLGRRAV